MLKKFQNYNLSYVEVILEALNEKVDVQLRAENFNYLLDSTYSLDYLTYPLEENFEDLISMLKKVTPIDNKIFAVMLPCDTSEIKPIDKQQQNSDILSSLNVDTIIELSKLETNFYKGLIDNPMGDFPYQFDSIHELGNYLLSEDDDLFLLLINTIFFPSEFGWMLIFDYDFEALHIMYKPEIKDKLERNEYFIKNRYTKSEIFKMIAKAGE